jgi:hypothetical protein
MVHIKNIVIKIRKGKSMKQLTREQQAVFNFNEAAIQLRPITETDLGMSDYQDFYDYFTSGISRFIESELNYRQAQRCSEIGIQPELEKHSFERGKKCNETGITYLKNSKECFVKFTGQQLDLNKTDSGFQKVLEKYKIELKEVLSELEIKGSDAKQLSEKIDEVLGTLAIGNSGEDLLDYMQKKITELSDVRATDGRGAETNIAVWKLLAAVVLLGLGAWAVYKCYYSKWLCSKREKAIYDTIMAVAMIVFGACE